MNEKASVSEQLSAKHKKTLEGLLKLPENRECADCKSRGPRWASVNLGIFICMHCSGIHRSLGVHISKVRSTTLDTWLPEQVTFIQSMGNEKSNSYWEAELPPNYDRVGIENFIRAKYAEKRWVPRTGNSKSPLRVSGAKASIYGPEPGSDGYRQINNISRATEERKITNPSISDISRATEERKISSPPHTNINLATEERKISYPPISHDSSPASRSCTEVLASVSQQVTTYSKPQETVKYSESAVPKSELPKKEGSANPVAAPPKVDYATELFNLLCMDDSTENGSKTSADAAEAISTAGKRDSPNSAESMIQPKYEVENTFNGPPIVAPSFDKSQEGSKNNVMNFFEKSGMMSSSSFSTRQLAMLSHQQLHSTTTVAAPAKSNGYSQTFPSNAHTLGYNGVHLPIQNWRTTATGHQAPTIMMPVTDVQKYIQIGNSQPMYTTGNSMNRPVASTYRPGLVASINGATNVRATMPPPPAFPAAWTQPPGQYDFSSLTEGMFTRR